MSDERTIDVTGNGDQGGNAFDFFLQNDDGTSTLLTPQSNQTGEELFLDLSAISSGKLRIRKRLPTQAREGVAQQISVDMFVGPSEVQSGSTAQQHGSVNNLPLFPPPLPKGSSRSKSESVAATGSVLVESHPGPPVPTGIPIGKAVSFGMMPSYQPQRPVHKLDNMSSMRVIAQLSSLSDTQGRTTLHTICASPTINLRRIKDLLEKFPDMVEQKDHNGQLPLHILGNNSDLVNSHESQKIATKCALLLMDVYPQSILMPDLEGRMPFTFLILKWVEWTFDHDEQNSKSTRMETNEDESYRVADIITKINRKMRTGLAKHSSSIQSSFSKASKRQMERQETSGSGSTSIVDSLRSSLKLSSNRFPPVMIFEEVEWCFQMLSYGMDHLGGNPLDPGKKVRPQLAYNKQRQDRENLAANIAEIPCLLKTILLVEATNTKSFILECSAIRRTLFCPETIGPWLTSMLRYKKGTSAEVAVDFMATISKLDVEDYVGEYRKALPHDEKLFHAAKLNIYKEVEKVGDMIPSLLTVGEETTDRAVATSLVWFVMNRRIATPFTVGVGITDLKLHIAVMFSFRQIVLDPSNREEYFVLFPWMTFTSVIFWVAVHHLVRKTCEIVALARISRTSAKNLLFEWWNIIDIAGIVLAMLASIRVEKMHTDRIDSPVLMALTLGLLWLRLLGFLKVVNEQLATFILALTRMMFDLRFFSVVLFLFILMFGDMFQLLVRNSVDIDCSSDDLDPAIEDFCSAKSIDSYLRTYAIVIGDFEFEQYNNFGGITFLWFCITFIGTVVMLNVLIAVVTLSYTNSQESSVILFRRSRAQFLATHETMERFLKPSVSQWSEKMPVLSPTYLSLMLLRWSMLLSFLLTTLWTSLYMIEMTAHSIRTEHYFFTAPCLVLVLAMIYSLWIILVLTITTMIEQCLPGDSDLRRAFFNVVEKSDQRMVKQVSAYVFGIHRNDTEGGTVIIGQNAEILGRLDHLEGMLEQILAIKEREEKEDLVDFEESSFGFPGHDDHCLNGD